MNELQVFNYGDTPIRTVEREDGVWWVLKDVCTALNITDHISVTRRLDEDEKGVGQILTPGGTQEMSLVNEPGLYNVILRSDKPEARDFKRWVTHEVIPSIRKTGSYAMQPKTTAEMFAMQAQINLEVEQRMNALEAANEKTEKKIIGMANILQASIVPAESWQDKTNDAISALVEENGYNHQKYRRSLYDQLERTAKVDLTKRQTRLRNRMEKQGMTKTQQKEISKLYVIAQDQKLRFIFDAILREEQAKRIAVS